MIFFKSIGKFKEKPEMTRIYFLNLNDKKRFLLKKVNFIVSYIALVRLSQLVLK